jgi:hypothetical protein
MNDEENDEESIISLCLRCMHAMELNQVIHITVCRLMKVDWKGQSRTLPYQTYTLHTALLQSNIRPRCCKLIAFLAYQT